MNNRGILFAGAVAAAVLGGPSLASAQAYLDSPPGAYIQDRGYVQSEGYPAESPYWGYRGAYAYAGPRAYLHARVAPRRFYHRY